MPIKKIIFIIISLLLIITIFMIQEPNQKEKNSEKIEETMVELPDPDKAGDLSLEESISERRSIRNYQDNPLTLKEISQILWSAQGITDPASDFRAAPSAGALYPLSLYLSINNVENLDPGLYEYIVDDHELKLKLDKSVKDEIYNVALQQTSIKESSVIFIIAADYEITERKYRDRAQRYVHMEAGHAGQNIYLQTTALDLGTVAIGAFHDDGLKEILGIDEDPIYLFPVGNKN